MESLTGCVSTPDGTLPTLESVHSDVRHRFRLGFLDSVPATNGRKRVVQERNNPLDRYVEGQTVLFMNFMDHHCVLPLFISPTPPVCHNLPPLPEFLDKFVSRFP